jgi:HSP20 family molecular chaperone IbpA
MNPSHIIFVQAATSVSENPDHRLHEDKSPARLAGGLTQQSLNGGLIMRTYDLTPFYRSTVGFDRLFSLLDRATPDGGSGYPPYNIERTGENSYLVTVAVSGFSQGELSIVAKENTLTIKGEKTANANNEGNAEVLYRGIAARALQIRSPLMPAPRRRTRERPELSSSTNSINLLSPLAGSAS